MNTAELIALRPKQQTPKSYQEAQAALTQKLAAMRADQARIEQGHIALLMTGSVAQIENQRQHVLNGRMAIEQVSGLLNQVSDVLPAMVKARADLVASYNDAIVAADADAKIAKSEAWRNTEYKPHALAIAKGLQMEVDAYAAAVKVASLINRLNEMGEAAPKKSAAVLAVSTTPARYALHRQIVTMHAQTVERPDPADIQNPLWSGAKFIPWRPGDRMGVD